MLTDAEFLNVTNYQVSLEYCRVIEAIARERTIDLCIEDVKDSFEQDCCRAEVIAALAALKEKK